MTAHGLRVVVHSDVASMARAVAQEAAAVMRAAVDERGEVNVMFATGNSQLAFVDALVDRTPGVPWERTTVFHMDEYVGAGPDHPAGFQRWIRERIGARVPARRVNYLEGLADPQAECQRYASLLTEHPLDLCCLGIGENGHLAFNDPPVADFDDPETVKVVELDLACRRQQVGEGHFRSVADVPTHALTVTIPALLSSRVLIAVVPEARKAEAVRVALDGPLDAACPASALRTASRATVHLDPESARLWSGP